MLPLHSLCFLSIITTISIAVALPQSSSNNLPDDITKSVPACAQPCLVSFITEGFPTIVCSDRGDLECLCSKNSTSGYTVGEAALRCVSTKCSADTGTRNSAYSICDGQKNALPNTHSIITATRPSSSANSTTTTVQTTSTQITRSSSTTATSTSDEVILTAPAKPSPPSTAFVPTSSTSPTQSTSETIAANAAAVADKPSRLTSAQIGGIAAASSASASLAVVAVLFIICLRRRKRVHRQSEKVSFDLKKAPMTPPIQSLPRVRPIRGKDPRGGAGGVGISKFQRISASLRPPVPPKAGEKRWSKWPRKYERPEDIGVAVSPEGVQDTSPKSIASHRTTSRLLPDKPIFGLLPVPAQVHPTRPMRPESAATEFEDLEDGSLDAARIAELYAGHWPVEKDDALGRAAPQTSASASRTLLPAPVLSHSTDRTYRPQLSLRLPTSLTPGGKMRGTMYLAPNPNDEAANPNGQPRAPPPEIEQRDILQPQTYTSLTRKKTPKKQTPKDRWRSSDASETTFESSGEVTPENEQDTLSPVAESPHQVRYPAIPSSSSTARRLPSARKINIQPPSQTQPHNLPPPPRGRPPVTTTAPSTTQPRCQSPSSLLAKRRGDRAAAELEMKLRVRKNENAMKQNQAWKEIKDPTISASGQTVSQDGLHGEIDMIQSPTGAWVPKLTPTRRGEELYLSVQ